MTQQTWNALDAYNGMMRSLITPDLLAAGLTGSGGKYELPCEGAWALIGFQKWRPVTKARVAFTVNLSYFDRAEWSAKRAENQWLGDAPEHNANYVLWGETQRLGVLVPTRRDHWWDLTLGTDVEPLASEVIESLLRYGLPWLESQANATHLRHG
ncbi:DUF4304 domain-containing protein [Demequina sp.]|uniref:DUF4304 domain-containing protein n=1 Tax=Demequina sp. TaxID=2050685 RepID=UPI003D126758